MARHYGLIGCVANLRAILREEGGLRRNYAGIGYLAKVVLDNLEELTQLEKDGVPMLEARFQNVLILHRKVMILKEVREKEYRLPCEGAKKRTVKKCARCGFRSLV